MHNNLEKACTIKVQTTLKLKHSLELFLGVCSFHRTTMLTYIVRMNLSRTQSKKEAEKRRRRSWPSTGTILVQTLCQSWNIRYFREKWWVWVLCSSRWSLRSRSWRCGMSVRGALAKARDQWIYRRSTPFLRKYLHCKTQNDKFYSCCGLSQSWKHVWYLSGH